MKKITIKVSGMHCKSCEMLLKEELTDIGVSKCEADHKSGNTTIVFDESKITVDSIKSAIKKLGYGVKK